MKGLILFLLGVIIGGYAIHVADRRDAYRHASGHWDSQRLRDTAGNVGGDINDKLQQWHLTGDDIRNDLANAGEIVRQNAAVAGAKIADARIGTVIKAKFILDKDLSARDIGVDVHDGTVVLSGSATSPALVGKAIALALDTGGVRQVISHLTVEAGN